MPCFRKLGPTPRIRGSSSSKGKQEMPEQKHSEAVRLSVLTSSVTGSNSAIAAAVKSSGGRGGMQLGADLG